MARKRKRFRHLRRRQRWELNCERVFTVLTGGPFPTGSPEDDLIEAHLSFCPDCRRLAESLRPTGSMLAAVDSRDMGSGADVPDHPNASGLPGYWVASERLSALKPLDLSVAPRRAKTGHDAQQRLRRMRMAVAVVLILVAAALACYAIFR